LKERKDEYIEEEQGEKKRDRKMYEGRFDISVNLRKLFKLIAKLE